MQVGRPETQTTASSFFNSFNSPRKDAKVLRFRFLFQVGAILARLAAGLMDSPTPWACPPHFPPAGAYIMQYFSGD